jgi:hypothetical protein
MSDPQPQRQSEGPAHSKAREIKLGPLGITASWSVRQRQRDCGDKLPMIRWKVRRSSSPSNTRDVEADLTISFGASRLARLLNSWLPTPPAGPDGHSDPAQRRQ